MAAAGASGTGVGVAVGTVVSLAAEMVPKRGSRRVISG